MPPREENPIEVAISLLWNASIRIFFRQNGKWDTITQKCIYAYNSLNVTGIYLSESCEKSNGVIAEKIQRFLMVWFTLTTKQNLSLLINGCMCVFSIDKKPLKIVHSLILQSIKLSTLIFTTIHLYSHMQKK